MAAKAQSCSRPNDPLRAVRAAQQRANQPTKKKRRGGNRTATQVFVYPYSADVTLKSVCVAFACNGFQLSEPHSLTHSRTAHTRAHFSLPPGPVPLPRRVLPLTPSRLRVSEAAREDRLQHTAAGRGEERREGLQTGGTQLVDINRPTLPNRSNAESGLFFPHSAN